MAARRVSCALLVVLAAALSACGKGKDGESAAGGDKSSARDASESANATGLPTEAELAKSAEDTRKALLQANNGKEIKAVEPAQIKALLPEKIGDTKRGTVSSEHTQAMGMDISEVSAPYRPEAEGAEGPNLRIKITDIGNLSGTMSMGYTMWATMNVSHETDTGYDKSTKYKGWPGHEQYDREGKNGQIEILVAKRFVVEAHGDTATIEQIRGVLDAIDLAKLAALAQ